MKPGRIDVHSHILPGIDDGCSTLEQSLACARILVENGYTHAFCTPHIWPNLDHYNRPALIQERTAQLQEFLLANGVPLKLLPGGELNLRPEILFTGSHQIVTYALAGRYCLFDLWVERLPDYFDDAVKYLQDMGLTLFLAHPERMRAVQEDPGLADHFAQLGLLLQGNLQCFSDAPEAPTRRLAEKFLAEGRYFMLGSDTHTPDTLGKRMDGLQRATELAGEAVISRLTRENPRALLDGRA